MLLISFIQCGFLCLHPHTACWQTVSHSVQRPLCHLRGQAVQGSPLLPTPACPGSLYALGRVHTPRPLLGQGPHPLPALKASRCLSRSLSGAPGHLALPSQLPLRDHCCSPPVRGLGAVWGESWLGTSTAWSTVASVPTPGQQYLGTLSGDSVGISLIPSWSKYPEPLAQMM